MKSWIDIARRFKRRTLGVDRRLIAEYMKSHSIRQLHIGSGEHLIVGWLNTDIGMLPGVVTMDATEEFPFPDNTFDYVFSEHMIEHVSYEDGAVMLRECHRVMRPGGVIRIVTPDLAAAIGLYNDNRSAIQQKYLSYFMATFLPNCRPVTAVFALNAMFRLWGHQFIYDKSTLAGALAVVGFKSVKRERLGISDHPELTNLENTQRYAAGLLDFESLALEASK